MQTYSTEFLQQIVNPLTIEKQNDSNSYLLVIASSYAFKLSSTDNLIPHHKALSEISDTISFYNTGIDEGLPKNKAECIILGKNIIKHESDKQVVSFSMNQIKKSLTVYPKRSWIKQGKDCLITVNGNLESIFISSENTYGGKGYQLNPNGIGFYVSTPDDKDELLIPQVELSTSPITSSSQKNIIPGSFSPIQIDWHYRSRHYGKINKQNHPAIPKDTTEHFFQSSPLDQQQDNPFIAGDKFTIDGMSKNQTITGQLPNYSARIFIMNSGKKLIEHEVLLDTIIFFPNEDIGFATFRAKIPVKTYDAKEHKTYIFALDHAETSLQKNIEEYKNLLDTDLESESLLVDIEKTLLPSYFKV